MLLPMIYVGIIGQPRFAGYLPNCMYIPVVWSSMKVDLPVEPMILSACACGGDEVYIQTPTESSPHGGSERFSVPCGMWIAGACWRFVMTFDSSKLPIVLEVHQAVVSHHQ